MNYIGIDLGKTRDFTAIAIVREDPVYRGLVCRGLRRIPLRTPFTEVVRKVEELVWRLGGNVEIAVDATGLGAPVMEMLKASSLTCEVAPVVITGGERTTRSGGTYRVPKKDLIARLQMLFEKRQIRIAARLEECDRLVRELLDLRPDKLAGVKEHDDLVMALALGCWQASRPRIGFGEGRIL